jgi:hypothetical protein
MNMKYWCYFMAKLTAVFGVLLLGWVGLHAIMPEPETFMRVKLDGFLHDLEYTFAVFVYCLVGVGLVYLAILDQRYRCRTCLRRLRMPLSRGSWNQILLGPPRTEYICPYGHGTLRVPDVHLASPEKIDWRPIDDMWRELYELEESRK